jgi:hypothetical protein
LGEALRPSEVYAAYVATKSVGWMYVAAKTSNGRTYYQLVKSVRVNGKPTHRVVCYLGKHKTVKAALEAAHQDLDALYTSPLHDELTAAVAAVRHDEDRIKMRRAKALNKWHGGEIPSRDVVEATHRRHLAMALRRTYPDDATIEKLCTFVEDNHRDDSGLIRDALLEWLAGMDPPTEWLAGRDLYKQGGQSKGYAYDSIPAPLHADVGDTFLGDVLDVFDSVEYYCDWEWDDGNTIWSMYQFLDKELPLLEAKRKQARTITEAFEEKRAKIKSRIEKLHDVVTKFG